MNQWAWKPLAAVAAVLLAGGAGAGAWAQAAVEVPTAAVAMQSVGHGFELDGVVQPVKQSTVSAQTMGRVVALAVKAGDRVRAGQVLASIDDREAATGVQRSQAQVAQAEAELRNAQLQYDRTVNLQKQGFVSPAAMDTAEAQLKAAKAGRDQALAVERQSGLAQGYARVTAPFEGWVLQTLAEAGDLAAPGKPLVTLYAPLPLRVVVQLPVSRVAGLKAQSVELQLPNAGGAMEWMRPKAVTAIPSADMVSQTVEWRLDVPDAAARQLLPGQPVRVRFAAGQAQRLIIPAASVLHRGELTAVYTAADQGFALRAVSLGADHGSQGVEVLAGLKAQDRVALDPIKAGLAGAKPAAAKQ